MRNGLTTTRYQEVEQELTHIESYLVALAQELRAATSLGMKFNHTWLQADNALYYTRSLRDALHLKGGGEASAASDPW
jgi:energy-converting hydrogenase Eha subunit F